MGILILIFYLLGFAHVVVAMKEENPTISQMLKKRQTGLKPQILLKKEIEKIIKTAEEDAILSIRKNEITRFHIIDFNQYPEKKSKIYQTHYVQYICAYGYWKLFSDTTKNGQVQILPGWYLNPPTPLSEDFLVCNEITFSTQDSVRYSIVECPKTFTFEQLKSLMEYASKGSNKIQKIQLFTFKDFDELEVKLQLVELIYTSAFMGIITDKDNYVFYRWFLPQIPLDVFKAIIKKNNLYAKMLYLKPDKSSVLYEVYLVYMDIKGESYKKDLLDKTKILLAYGADPNMPLKIGRTVLTTICENLSIDLDFIKILLEGGGDPNIEDDVNRNALHYAIKNEKYELVMLLLKYGAKLNLVENYYGFIKLLLDSNRHTSADIIRIAVKHGIDLNFQDKHGRTMLLAAIAISVTKENGEIFLEELLKYDIDISSMLTGDWYDGGKYRGATYYDLMIMGLPDVPPIYDKMKQLISYPTEKAMELVLKYYEETFDGILGKKILEGNPRYNKNLIFSAVQMGRIDVVKFFLANGVNIDIEDVVGRTLLQHAALYKRKEITELLLNGITGISQLETDHSFRKLNIDYARDLYVQDLLDTIRKGRDVEAHKQKFQIKKYIKSRIEEEYKLKRKIDQEKIGRERKQKTLHYLKTFGIISASAVLLYLFKKRVWPRLRLFRK